MADCYQISPDGTLYATGQAAEACTGYVLLSGSEHAQFAFLQRLFEWPEADVAAAWLLGAFGLVLAMNVAGSVVGSVVKMMSTDRH